MIFIGERLLVGEPTPSTRPGRGRAMADDPQPGCWGGRRVATAGEFVYRSVRMPGIAVLNAPPRVRAYPGLNVAENVTQIIGKTPMVFLNRVRAGGPARGAGAFGISVGVGGATPQPSNRLLFLWNGMECSPGRRWPALPGGALSPRPPTGMFFLGGLRRERAPRGPGGDFAGVADPICLQAVCLGGIGKAFNLAHT